MIRKKENEKAIYNGEENSMPTGQTKDRSQTLRKMFMTAKKTQLIELIKGQFCDSSY